jgi:integrase
MLLTQMAILKAAPHDKPYKLADGMGLHLLVNPNGRKLWRLRYRFGGKQNMLGLGSFPEVSLASAREKRNDARKLVAAGIDPSQKRKEDKRAATTAANNTFGVVAAELIQNLKDSNAASATIDKNRWLLEHLASPLGARPINAITSAEILDLLKRVEKSGRRETARRLRGAIGSVFRLAIATLRAENDPTFALRGALLAPNVQHRPAITDELQLGSLVRSIEEYDGWPTLRAALQLTMLTMSRPGEVRHMRRKEIIFPKAKWEIPTERMKMRQPHDVPLSKQALAVLRDAWDLSPGSELVLPSIRSVKKPLSENAMNAALRRLGYGSHEVTAHGFRSSASTILNERGYNRDVIEVALAHQEQNQVRAAYNRAKYWKERVTLLQDWADLLDQFKQASIASQKTGSSAA